jgi:hypothetical protein
MDEWEERGGCASARLLTTAVRRLGPVLVTWSSSVARITAKAVRPTTTMVAMSGSRSRLMREHAVTASAV